MSDVRSPPGCDYLIVGGGTAGCVIAARLSENPACNVVLLEAGNSDSNPLLSIPGATAITGTARRFNWSMTTEPEPLMGNRRLMLSQARVLGGGSSINGMVYTRGQPWDYDHWRSLGANGWGFDDVLPAFRKSECSERGASHWHGGNGPLKIARGNSDLAICAPFLEACAASGIPVTDDLNAGAADGVGYYDSFFHRGRRSSTAHSFLHPAQNRRNLTVVTGAMVTRLLLDGGKARGCEYLLHGQRRVIHASSEVALCGGALRSPQLLMLSGIGRADSLTALGIAVQVDSPQVGANLQNHVSCKLAWSCTRPVTAYRYLNPWRAVGSGLEYALLRRGYLAQSPTPIGGFFRTDSAMAQPDIQFFMSPALMGRLDQGLLNLLPKEHGFSIFVNQGRPWSRGEVTLRSADPAIAPRVHGRYLSDPRDLDVLIRSAEIMRQIVRRTPLASFIGRELLPGSAIGTRADMHAYIRDNGGNHWHVSGTCRMGSDAEAVVDSRLRVRGIEGLRVADASVMPTLMNGNTAAPVIMIAEKAAEMMAADAD